MKEISSAAELFYLKAPARANLYLTGTCNLQCIHCYASELKARQTLSVKQWETIIRRLSKAGVLELVLLGGEPLLYPGFLDVMEALRFTDLGIKISTNGVLITTRTAEAISSVAKAGVQVSLDGPDAHSNDLIRGNGTFSSSVNGIMLLQRHGVPLTIGTVITKKNLNEAERMIGFVRELGIKGIHFMRVVPKGCACNNWNELKVNNEEWVKFVISIRTKTPKSVLLQIDGTYEYHTLLEPLGKCMTGCEAGRYEITVLPDGSIVPCEMFTSNIIGHALSHNVADLWEKNPHYECFRTAKARVADPCRSCAVDYCAGCRYQAFFETGDIHAADPACVRESLLFHNAVTGEKGNNNEK